MFEIILKRDNSLEVHFNLPDHQEVLPSIQKVNETLWKAFGTPSQQLSSFPQAFGILRTLLLHHHNSDEEEPL